jgi:cardiolipin synthase
MQAAFMDNWMETCGEVLHGEQYFPPLEPVGSQPAQVFRSSADDGSESVRLMYLISLASAEGRVRLANSYFVPDSLVVRTLVDAQRRGATVEIIVPGPHIDQRMVRRASRALWGPLLEAGVAIYEYQPTMYHVKVAIVDEIWTSVGSTNFDNRSFRLNDEANLNVYDPRFAEAQARVFEEDKRRARRVTLEEWRHRPWRERATEWMAALFRMQL